MEKLYKRFNIEDDLEWAYGGEIKEIKEDLERLEKLGATHIDIVPYEQWGSVSVSIKAVCDRFETDKELKDSINREKQRQDAIKKKELAELERLKLKYNS